MYYIHSVYSKPLWLDTTSMNNNCSVHWGRFFPTSMYKYYINFSLVFRTSESVSQFVLVVLKFVYAILVYLNLIFAIIWFLNPSGIIHSWTYRLYHKETVSFMEYFMELCTLSLLQSEHYSCFYGTAIVFRKTHILVKAMEEPRWSLKHKGSGGTMLKPKI